MYDNIGGKIKGLAKVTFIAEAIAAVISGFAIMGFDDDTILIGLLVLIIGPIIAWVSSWLLYGFGELIDKSCEIERNTRGEKSGLKEQKLLNSEEINDITPADEIPLKKVETVIPEENKGTYWCPKCGC